MSSSQQNHALCADNQINSPYKRAAHSGTFGGVLGDKENAGSEARAAAAAAAQSKLAQEIAHHLKGAASSPGAHGKQQQQQQTGPATACGLSPTLRSVFFAGTAAAATTTADSVHSPKAVIGAAGSLLPLSPSSTAARFSNTNFDRYGGGGGEGITPHSRTVRGAGFAQAHTPTAAAAAAARVPVSRPKKPIASRREVQERRGCGVDVDEGLPSPTSELKTPDKDALSDAPVKPEAISVPGGVPKRSRSPVAGLTLPPPARCDDEVSTEFEAKARRRSATHAYSSAAARAASGAGDLFSNSGGSGGGSVADSGGSCDGRWRKLHARGGGVDGPPRLKLSVETAGDNDDVLLSPSGHQGGEDEDDDAPARFYCSSPVSLSLSLSSSSRLGSGGRRDRGRDNVLTSSVDSEWSMGSIDETAARELDNTREEDKSSGGDPVARMLLCQSDECISDSAAAAATTTREGAGCGKDDETVPPAARGAGCPSTPAVGVAADVGVSSPHAFEVAGADGGGAAANRFRSKSKGSIFDAPHSGVFSLGSRGAGLGDASAVPRTRLFKPVAFRLP